MGKGRQGKEWEAQLGTALKAAGCWSYNTNDINPATDYAANWKGLGMLLEAKEVHCDTLSFSCITPREKRNLNSKARAGGLAAVAICRAYPNKRRAWICTWQDWLHLEETIGRKSIPLKDGQRPPQLVEIPRFTRPNGLGNAFDLQPALRSYLVALARKIIREYPEALNDVQTQTRGPWGQGHLATGYSLPAGNACPAATLGSLGQRTTRLGIQTRALPLPGLRYPKRITIPSRAIPGGWGRR